MKGMNRAQRRFNHRIFKDKTLTSEEAIILLKKQGFTKFRISDEIVTLELIAPADLALVMREIFGIEIVEKSVIVDQHGEHVDVSTLRPVPAEDKSGPT